MLLIISKMQHQNMHTNFPGVVPQIHTLSTLSYFYVFMRSQHAIVHNNEMYIVLILNKMKQYDWFTLGIKQRHQLLYQHTRRVTALTSVLM